MAVLINVTTESGVTVEQAYARIDNVVGNKNGLTVYLNYYVNAEAANSHPPFMQTVHLFTPSQDDASVRWDKQAYEHIKQLPEFDGALDC